MSDAGCFVVWAHKVLFHLSVRYLKTLINSIDLMWCLRYLVSGCCNNVIRENFLAWQQWNLSWGGWWQLLTQVWSLTTIIRGQGSRQGPKSLLRMSWVSIWPTFKNTVAEANTQITHEDMRAEIGTQTTPMAIVPVVGKNRAQGGECNHLIGGLSEGERGSDQESSPSAKRMHCVWESIFLALKV